MAAVSVIELIGTLPREQYDRPVATRTLAEQERRGYRGVSQRLVRVPDKSREQRRDRGAQICFHEIEVQPRGDTPGKGQIVNESVLRLPFDIGTIGADRPARLKRAYRADDGR